MPSYLLLENGDDLLLEDGSRILLEGDGDAAPTAGPHPITVSYREATEQRHTLTWKDNR